MAATGAEDNVGLTEDINQSLGYALQTETAPVYNRTTGEIEYVTLDEVMPGILVRPAYTTLRELPTIDLRDDATKVPYLTWFPRQAMPAVDTLYGGATKEQSFWEINVKMGEQNLLTRQRIQDWLTAFLTSKGALPIYFWYSVSGDPPVSRGEDVIAQAYISDVIVVPHVEVSAARGTEDWIVVNFSLETWKAEKST